MAVAAGLHLMGHGACCAWQSKRTGRGEAGDEQGAAGRQAGHRRSPGLPRNYRTGSVTGSLHRPAKAEAAAPADQ
jgi:hypothetical protein